MISLTQLHIMLQCLADVLRQRRYLRRALVPELAQLQRSASESFDSYMYEKIMRYYGLLTTAALAENYCRLQGRRLGIRERQISTWLGAMTPLFDDLFDRKLVPDEHIIGLMGEPWTRSGQGLEEMAILHFHRRILAGLSDTGPYLESTRQVFASQQASRAQAGPVISEELLTKVTFDKGGYSLLAYRAILLPAAGGEEKAMLYQLGGVLQLCNDVFDLYKDLQEGVVTLPLACKDFGAFRKHYLEEVTRWMVLARRMPFGPRRIERFIAFMLMIISRGIVALDQLVELEDRKGRGLDPARCSREELICDMETPGHFLKCLRIASRLRKSG